MARARTYRVEGIVLNHRKLSEKDFIVTILSKDGSTVDAVAKGARRPGSQLTARVDLFCEGDYLLARGRSLDVVAEAALKESHPALRTDWDLLAAASVISEAAYAVSRENLPDPWTYAITSSALDWLEKVTEESERSLIVSAYLVKLLARQGWQPYLEGCVACGDGLVFAMSAEEGGLLCESCAASATDAMPVDEPFLVALGKLYRMRFSEIVEDGALKEMAPALLDFARYWSTYHLEQRVKSLDFFMGVGPVQS